MANRSPLAWRFAAVASALTFRVALLPSEFVLAQEDERVSGWTEKLNVRRVHIGHDWSEFASVLIVGNAAVRVCLAD